MNRRKNPLHPVGIVGAGPGDPELLTIRALDQLSLAQVVIADAAVASIASARAPEAEVIVAADEEGAALEPTDAAKLVVEHTKNGSQVVRLIAGDPSTDGALMAEIAVLRRSKIPFEVSPGVSPITAVPLYAGFPLLGKDSHGLRVVDADRISDPAEWAALTDPKTTLVVRNGADRALEIGAGLMSGEKPLPASTSIAITRDGSTVEQRTIATTLGELAATLKLHKGVVGAGMVIVGGVVDARSSMNWFESKPLFGWRVLVPRTKEQAGAMSEQLRRFGAVPAEVPTISVEPPRTPQQMERAIQGLEQGRYRWVAFTSANAVKAVREKLEEYGLDARALAGIKIAAVGDQTAAALLDFGVRADLVPSGEQSTRGLLDDWPPFEPEVDMIGRVFLPRADIATEALVEGLTKLGWEVDDITAYRTVRAAPPPAEIREAIKGGQFDAVMFTSSSTVRNLVGIAGKPHASTIVACIGPQTAETAKEHGLRVDVLAESASVEQLTLDLAAHAEELRLAALEAGEATWRPSKKRTRRRSATKV